MKSERGVTLVSLIVYVIAMLITVTVVTIVTSYFYKNVDIEPEKYTYFSEFTKIETYFAEEANIEENKVLQVSSPVSDSITQQYLALSSGNQYTYIKNNKAIYKNNVKIASGVEKCEFQNMYKNGKEAIKVTVKIQEKEKEIEYVFKN